MINYTVDYGICVRNEELEMIMKTCKKHINTQQGTFDTSIQALFNKRSDKTITCGPMAERYMVERLHPYISRLIQESL